MINPILVFLNMPAAGTGINKSAAKSNYGFGVYLDAWAVILLLYTAVSYWRLGKKIDAAAITFDTAGNADASSYEVIEYWEPRDGSLYADDIRKKFPWYLYRKAMDSQRYIKEQKENCERMAQQYFASAR